MITLVDSPGDPSANSYVSLAFSDSHMEQSVGRSDWATLDIETKKAALIEATRVIDSIFTWYSRATDQLQALDWPQESQWDKSGRRVQKDEIPKALMQVTSDLAYNIYKFGGTSKTTEKVDMVKVGPITLNLDPASKERFFETVDFTPLNIFGEYVIRRSGAAYNVKVLR